MIRPLRQRHRRLVLALGVFIPVAFTFGIAARKSVPEVDSLPKELVPVTHQYALEEWQRSDLFPNSPVQVRLMREHRGAGKFALEFSAPKDFVRPDLIVYWAAGTTNTMDSLPENAILLGAFSSAAFPIPDEIVHAGGQMVLFSLADNIIVDVSKPSLISDSTK